MLESKTVHNFHHLQGTSYYYRAHFEIYLVMFLHLKGKRNSEQLKVKETNRDRERERESHIETELFSEKNKKSMTSSNNGKYKIQS